MVPIGAKRGGEIVKLARRVPKDAQRRFREVTRMYKEVSDLQNCSKFNRF